MGWNPDTQKYVFYPTPPADGFHYGQGYFLQETNTADHAGADQSERSELYGDTATIAEHLIPLRTGWNLIGDPYTVSLDLAKLQIIDTRHSLVDVPTRAKRQQPRARRRAVHL